MGRFRVRYALFGAVMASGALWMRHVVMPRRPADAETPRPRPLPDGPAKPTPDGGGVRIVVNPNSGPAVTPAPTEALREGLPAADVYELQDGDDLAELLCDPAHDVIGAAGGDGTLAAAAAIATERDALLVAVPAGTLNHLARDLGVNSVDDVVRAVREGHAARIDVGCAHDRIFVNTLTFGGYAVVVDARERLQPRIGKWPALLVALVRELPRMEPLRVEIDGRPMRVWLAWVGNCAYSPDGLGPLWREKLDDGLLDIRVVHGARRFSRTRFTVAALAGRLARCHVYSEWTAETLTVNCLDGPQRLAADGETFDGPAQFTVAKRRRALRVAVPSPD